MTIDWINFTPWASLSGGILLGVATAFFHPDQWPGARHQRHPGWAATT